MLKKKAASQHETEEYRQNPYIHDLGTCSYQVSAVPKETKKVAARFPPT